MLNINETATSIYTVNDINTIMEAHKLYAFAIDIEGKIYKRKVSIK